MIRIFCYGRNVQSSGKGGGVILVTHFFGFKQSSASRYLITITIVIKIVEGRRNVGYQKSMVLRISTGRSLKSGEGVKCLRADGRAVIALRIALK